MASTIAHEAACRAWALATGCISSVNDGIQSRYGDMLIEWIGGVSPGMCVNMCVRNDIQREGKSWWCDMSCFLAESVDAGLIRIGLGLLGSLVRVDGSSMDLGRVLEVCLHVAQYVYGMDVCMDALGVVGQVMSVDPERMYSRNNGRVVGLFVSRLLTDEEQDEGVLVGGCVCALRAHPVATLGTLKEHVRALKITQERAKTILMACVRHAYGLVAEYEPDVEIPHHGMMSMLEKAVKMLGGLPLVECQNIMQELVLFIPTDVEEAERIREVMARLASQVCVVEGQAPGAKKDMEEGELVLANAPHTSVEGIVPVKVSKTLKIAGLPDSVTTDVVKTTCDAFTGIQYVKREGSCVLVTCTSMPGAVRCYEAMYTRGTQFWAVAGYDGATQVDLCSVGSSLYLLMEGVTDVEQEDAIKRVLGEGGVVAPSSLIPIHVGVVGVILCFESIQDTDGAFACLGGVEEPAKRERDAIDSIDVLEDTQGKKPRLEEYKEKPPEDDALWSGRILRNTQVQCDVHARSFKGKTVIDWPNDIEVNQRVDVQYVCSTLMTSVSEQDVHLAVVYPADEGNAQGLLGFDAYLRGKKRAGVALLPPQRSMKKRTLYLIPVSDHVCISLRIDPREVPSPGIIGMVVDQ